MIWSLGILQEILKGLVIGVGAGVTTAALLGLRSWLIRYRNRREQIPYIRDLITSQMDRILSATDLPPYKPGAEPIAADRVRFAHFNQLRTALLVALSSRVTALTYKEVSSLHKIIADTDRIMTDLTLNERGIMPLARAQPFFASLQSLLQNCGVRGVIEGKRLK